MKRLLSLLAIVLVAGAAVGLLSRVWHPAASAPEALPAPEVVAVVLEITRVGVVPASVAIAKNRLVRLSVTNRDPHPVTLSLTAYEDRLHTGPIAPGSTWSGAFVADRPGEAFAWLVDGMPVGRIDITGSHLEEGHR